MKYNDQLKGHLHRLADDLHPLRVRALFEAIPDEDLDLLDIQGACEGAVGEWRWGQRRRPYVSAALLAFM